jgi:hypothetical protein
MLVKEEKFSINKLGSETQERYIGEFTVRLKLSQRLKMLRSRLIRESLGEFAQYATQDDRLRAVALAECEVSITKAPDWWKQADNGREMEDDNIVDEVWAGVARAQGRLKEEEAKKAEEDAKVIKESLETGEASKKDEE